MRSAAHLPPPETAPEHQDDQSCSRNDDIHRRCGGEISLDGSPSGHCATPSRYCVTGRSELDGPRHEHLRPTAGPSARASHSCARHRRGNWEIVGEHIPPEDGQLLCLFDGICVLHAALNTRPGLDGDGKVAATMIKFSNYVATPLAEFAPKDQLVGVIIVNAIPGEAHPVAEHSSAFNPRDADAHATGYPGGGRTRRRSR